MRQLPDSVNTLEATTSQTIPTRYDVVRKPSLKPTGGDSGNRGTIQMAQIKCPDCGHSISAVAAACIYCGRPMVAPDVSAAAPAKEPSPPPTVPSHADLDASGWLLWRDDRQFGPMTGHELVVYFTSKMVTAGDAVTGPCWSDKVSAIDAANLLQVQAPLPATTTVSATAATSSGPIVYVSVEPVARGIGGIAMWLLLLFALN